MNDAGRCRTELAMFQPPLAAPADADANAPRAVVLPAPDAAGLLPTLDGRKQRVPDPAWLVGAALLRGRAYRYLSPALRDGAQRRSVGRGRRLFFRPLLPIAFLRSSETRVC